MSPGDLLEPTLAAAIVATLVALMAYISGGKLGFAMNTSTCKRLGGLALELSGILSLAYGVYPKFGACAVVVGFFVWFAGFMNAATHRAVNRSAS